MLNVNLLSWIQPQIILWETLTAGPQGFACLTKPLSFYSSLFAWGPPAGQRNLVTPSQLPQVISGLSYTATSQGKDTWGTTTSNLQSSHQGNFTKRLNAR